MEDPGTTTVYTVGHSHDPEAQFLALLRQHGISLVVDVRSRPWIKRAQHFNREAIEPALRAVEIDYLWLGDHLGGRPDCDRFYDSEGYALYQPISEEPWFMKAIGQVEYEAERRAVALVCLEEEPERCHRYHLLGRALRARELEVCHLRRDGQIESQAAVAERLGEGQTSLLAGEPVWRSLTPQRF